MFEHNYALYYPTIEFTDPGWLWNAALLWDKIYRIVPSNYEPADSDNIKALVETGDIGTPLRPDAYTAEVASDFITKLETDTWHAAALENDTTEEYARIHQDKIDIVLRDMIVARGSAASFDEWLHVPVDFEAHYMTYLANHMAEKNNLQLLSDSIPGWTCSTYFNYDGQIDFYPMEDFSHQLATLVVKDFLPQNPLQITPKELIKYRENYRDERRRFLSAIQDAAQTIGNCEDEEVFRSHLEDIKKDVESALKDYRGSLSTLKITELTGIKCLSLPVSTKVIAFLTGVALSLGQLAIIASAGLAIGAVSGIVNYYEQRKKLDRECDFSYLIDLSREWKNVAQNDMDYNYWLYRDMEEFIND